MHSEEFMEVEFSSVFRKVAGVERINVALVTPITVEKLIRYIAGQCDGFRNYALMMGNDQLCAHLNFVREGRVLLLSDIVYDQDCLKVFLPVAGG